MRIKTIYIIYSTIIILLFISSDAHSAPIDSLTLKYNLDLKNACKYNFKYKRKKNFILAASETFGMNMGLWAFDRYVFKGHYAYISFKTIKENFKHGFEWDNDHLNTNMFAHPYNGSLFFNAGRSNGFNFWQSELFAISGSAMWELFMECEYPSTNDIIATPIGGAALGEIFYRTSDLILDDRATRANRFGRELASFIISPIRGVTRIITGEAWKKRAISGREFTPPIHIELSLGSRILSYHNNDHIVKAGISSRLNIEYGDPFDGDSKTPYDYFSCLAEFNVMKTQPLLSRIEIMGRLLSKELVYNKKYDLSIGLFQHFDFFDSDTISQYSPTKTEPCIVPYKLGAPACVGIGSMFLFHNNKFNLVASGHFNGIILGGILSDYYRYYNRNYNWASGYSLKFGIKGQCWNDKLSFNVNNQFYKLYTKSHWGFDTIWTETPNGKPVNVAGDNSVGSFYHLEGEIDYKLLKSLFLTLRFDLYNRNTHYKGYKSFNNIYTSNLFLNSRQLCYQIMLTYKF